MSVFANQNLKDERPAGIVCLGMVGKINSTSNCLPNFLKIPKTNEYRQNNKVESIRPAAETKEAWNQYQNDAVTFLKNHSSVGNRQEYIQQQKQKMLQNDPTHVCDVINKVDKSGRFKQVLDTNNSKMQDFYSVNHRGEANKTMKNVPARQLKNRRCASAMGLGVEKVNKTDLGMNVNSSSQLRYSTSNMVTDRIGQVKVATIKVPQQTKQLTNTLLAGSVVENYTGPDLQVEAPAPVRHAYYHLLMNKKGAFNVKRSEVQVNLLQKQQFKDIRYKDTFSTPIVDYNDFKTKLERNATMDPTNDDYIQQNSKPLSNNFVDSKEKLASGDHSQLSVKNQQSTGRRIERPKTTTTTGLIAQKSESSMNGGNRSDSKSQFQSSGNLRLKQCLAQENYEREQHKKMLSQKAFSSIQRRSEVEKVEKYRSMGSQIQEVEKCSTGRRSQVSEMQRCGTADMAHRLERESLLKNLNRFGMVEFGERRSINIQLEKALKNPKSAKGGTKNISQSFMPTRQQSFCAGVVGVNGRPVSSVARRTAASTAGFESIQVNQQASNTIVPAGQTVDVAASQDVVTGSIE